MSGVLGRIRALPRAMRWAIVAAAFVLGYFVVVEPALDASARASARADALQAGLDRRLDAAGERSEASRTLALAASQFGAPLPPGGPDRASALNARIEAILRDRSVSNLSIKARSPVALPRTAMEGGVPEGKQVQRLVLDVEFEADPSVAMAIVADLEKAREVSSVGRVVMRRVEREGRKTVQVSVSPEAWTLAARGGAR